MKKFLALAVGGLLTLSTNALASVDLMVVQKMYNVYEADEVLGNIYIVPVDNEEKALNAMMDDICPLMDNKQQTFYIVDLSEYQRAQRDFFKTKDRHSRWCN